jgi:hypothetical protein
MLNPIEPPWYVTRMPGGVTGTARKGLPMSIFDADHSIQTFDVEMKISKSRSNLDPS